MSHGESKVELSQAELKHVCQVEQKDKRSSGFGGTAAHLHLALTSLAPSGSPLSPPHFRLRQRRRFHNSGRRSLRLSRSVTFIFPPY